MPIEELYKELEQEGLQRSNGGFLSVKFRLFCRDYYLETRQTSAMMFALWELFKNKVEFVVDNIDKLDNTISPFLVVKNKKNKLCAFYRYDDKKLKWVEVKDSYFRSMIKRAFDTYIDESGIQWVNLNKMKKIRERRQKV